MAKSFSSWGALKKALQNEVRAALEETIDKSYQDTKENVDYFYASPEGRYMRTGQLAESVQQEISGSGDNLCGTISLDTSYVYNPSARTTQEIYGYAEDGGLLGNGGFWDKTKSDVEKNIQESFGKRFS